MSMLYVYKSLHIENSAFGITMSWSSRVTESGPVYISKPITDVCLKLIYNGY